MLTSSPCSSRRFFLKALGAMAGSAAVPALLPCTTTAATGVKRVQEQRILMGTFVGITALDASENAAQEAISHAYQTITHLEGLLSRFKKDSALHELNTSGSLSHAPRPLCRVVEHSKNLHQMSHGQFDITIAPLLTLLERTQGRPSKAELKETLQLVHMNGLKCQGSTLRFTAQGMSATLDGIAKGYIADQAAQTLQSHNIAHFLIDAGGDIRVQGLADGKTRPWHIAIEDPQKQSHYPARVQLKKGALATSGGYEIFFDPSGKSHHLLDPQNGHSPQYVRSVSVVAPTLMEADGLATALSLLTPQKALRLTASLPEHECLLVTTTGAKLHTKNWPIG